MKNNSSIRSELLLQRKQLNTPQKNFLSDQVCKQILSYFTLSDFSSIATYHAIGKEVDLSRLIQQSSRLYLPVVKTKNTMQFNQFRSFHDLTKNKYGILEPQNTPSIKLQELELCFVPLVAFDRKGSRVGMGGGFYDRYFEFNRCQQKPTILVGIAYDFQEDDTIQSQPWDIPMDMIITNKEIIKP